MDYLKLFIPSNQLFKIKRNFKFLEKNSNNDWIEETLIYTFEYISIINIQNLIIENENSKQKYIN